MDLSVNGPAVYFELPFDLPDTNIFTMKNLITQTTVTLFCVTLFLIIISAIATRRLTKRPGRFQVVLEKIIGMLYGLVEDTMGKHNLKFAPYIGTLFISSICCTLFGMTQILRSATADLSVTVAWALVTTGMVWYNNIKNFGFGTWLKGFTEPIVVMTPMNIVSEIANPVSMAFRHFGNVAGGSVLTALIYGALSALSSAIFGAIPGVVGEILGQIPFLTAGIPAFLSIYFDLFSGFVQALVFSLLTMVYVGAACPPFEELPEKTQKKILKKEERARAKQ